MFPTCLLSLPSFCLPSSFSIKYTSCPVVVLAVAIKRRQSSASSNIRSIEAERKDLGRTLFEHLADVVERWADPFGATARPGSNKKAKVLFQALVGLAIVAVNN
ncbi:hypothetical protein SLEP1_g13915 [Rubroshorea leprosula]|uniref:Uncharacterized protein n=1 Tax=Rubroshorea leprosula TaxID=152421 RepID=A0AAV5IT05_9ROSI|nr:hypothetical protein SLEP1_g13915 [Rubroshorea leprosula]